MTIDEMTIQKERSGCSYKELSKISGIPEETVRGILEKEIIHINYATYEALRQTFTSLSEKKKTEEATSSNESYVCEDSGQFGMTDGTGALDRSCYFNKTVDDYLELPEEVRVELIDGVFYDMGAPDNLHQMISGRIYNKLINYVDSHKGSCIPMIAPADVQLDHDDLTMVQPDVFVVCNRDKMQKQRTYGAPDLAIEVVSPSSYDHDTIRKLDKYRRAGVREYWIVIPDDQKVLVFFFERSDKPTEYTFEDKVPVNIWNDECKVDFKQIYDIVKLWA